MKRVTIVSAILFFVATNRIEGLMFVKPYPSSYFVIEGEPLTIPCAAGDANAYPKVTFKTKSQGGSTYEEIKSNASVFITNSTHYDTKQGLFITTAMLHISKIRYPEDDTKKGGSYKCWSSLGQAKDDLGSVVNVIQKSSLPRALVQGTDTASYGGSANLTCNLTYQGDAVVQLNKVVWIKNSSVIDQGSVGVAPIAITKATSRDGGVYVCAAEVNLKSARTTQIILGSATLNVRLKMVDGATQIIANVSDSVVMECPAEGFPLNVTWFRVNRNGQEIKLTEVPRFKDRITVSRPCSYCRYRLTIRNLQSHDQGHYVCRANTNTESARHHSNLYVRTEQNTSEVVTTVKPTTVVVTDQESVPSPSKSNLVHMVIFIVLGILLALSLLAIVFLSYKLITNRKQQNDTSQSDSQPENIEIVTETSAEKKSSIVELQPLMDTTADQSAAETADAQEESNSIDSKKMAKEDELGNDKELKPSDNEGKCSSQCDSFKSGKDQAKYMELAQGETGSSKTPTNPPHEGYCSVM